MKSHFIYSTILCYFLVFLPFALTSQSLEFLDKSTSEDIFTTHDFHASTYHDGFFYLAGEFWKDISFQNFSLSLPAGVDDEKHAFILKLNDVGQVEDLWHFESDSYVRINQMEVDPSTNMLTIVGQFRESLVYQDTSLNTDYGGEGFIMNMDLNGGLNWTKSLHTKSPTSFSSAEGMALDQSGNIFVGFEIFGEVELDGELFIVDESMSGALITKLTPEGMVLQSQQWFGNMFENIIDITDVLVNSDNALIVTGGFSGEMKVGETMIGSESPYIQAFVMQQSNQLEMNWAKQYEGSNSLVNCATFYEDRLMLSVQYRDYFKFDDQEITGSGSWGDLALLEIDDDGQASLFQHLMLNQNGGSKGVYGIDLIPYRDMLYVGGMYQGAVESEEGIVLENPGNSSFQLAFILAIDDQGAIQDIYNFHGSIGPSRIRTLASSASRLLFSGEFFTQIALEGEILQTTNSTLFYGAFYDAIFSHVDPTVANSTYCIEKYSPLVYQELFFQSHESIQGIRLMDASGNTLRSLSSSKLLHPYIDVSHLPTGIYFAQVRCDQGIETFKFVKQ